MRNTFEVWNWEYSDWTDRYEWAQHYAGESKEDACDKVDELKKSGAGCVKLEWR